jgi:hypothetical protein
MMQFAMLAIVIPLSHRALNDWHAYSGTAPLIVPPTHHWQPLFCIAHALQLLYVGQHWKLDRNAVEFSVAVDVAPVGAGQVDPIVVAGWHVEVVLHHWQLAGEFVHPVHVVELACEKEEHVCSCEHVAEEMIGASAEDTMVLQVLATELLDAAQ